MWDLQLPFFRELESADRVLVAGAGGGFDVFSGLPLYFALQRAGKQAFLANLTFSNLHTASGEWIGPKVLEVSPDAGGSQTYFPERELSAWFRRMGEEVPVYAFERAGVRPLADSYRRLADHLGFDTVILTDGGTDSLMRGDEVDLGTPEEDIASILAVAHLSIPRKILACVGFGVDAFHGICHALFLENVAALIREGAYLGTFSMTPDMPAVGAYQEATRAVLAATNKAYASIVCTSILSAIEGRFGDYHATQRTVEGTLFINPLMALCWCFWVDAVAGQLLYRDAAEQSDTMEQLSRVITAFRAQQREMRPWTDLPV
jgi:hypothetical protein